MTTKQNEIKPCLYCPGKVIACSQLGAAWFAACRMCLARGPALRTPKEAIDAHNAMWERLQRVPVEEDEKR